MANINDSAGIFTGGTLELFNEVERLVGRDGDIAYAQADRQRRLEADRGHHAAGARGQNR